MQKWIRLSAVLAGFGCLALPIAAADDSVAKIRERGALVLLCFPNFGNDFVSVDAEMGPMPKIGSPEHFQGVDIDLMRAFADWLGVELRVRPVSQPSFGALIHDLLAGQGDLIASSFSVTKERRKKVDFSDPYFTVRPLVVVRNERSASSVEDLHGLRPVVVRGSSLEEQLTELGFDAFVETEFALDKFTAVVEREADFLIAESETYFNLAPDFADLKVAFRLPTGTHYAIAVPKGSDLRQQLNRFLSQIKANGELNRILRRHLTPEVPENGPRPR